MKTTACVANKNCAGLGRVYLWNTEGLHFRMSNYGFIVELCRHHFTVWNLGGYHFWRGIWWNFECYHFTLSYSCLATL